jgi:periplasmic mercuric ion binding protein
MKSIKITIAIIAILITTGVIAYSQTSAQKSGTTKTETLKVWGNCDMCKARIEKTVLAAGATSADWSTETKMLTVKYDPSKTNGESLSKKLAAVGHDTEKFKADDKAYNALPSCCKYERKK